MFIKFKHSFKSESTRVVKHFGDIHPLSYNGYPWCGREGCWCLFPVAAQRQTGQTITHTLNTHARKHTHACTERTCKLLGSNLRAGIQIKVKTKVCCTAKHLLKQGDKFNCCFINLFFSLKSRRRIPLGSFSS